MLPSSFAQGRYGVLGLLGTGATAEVLSVVDTRLGVERALKRLEPSPDPATEARRQREARVLAQLNHPHIVAVQDAFVEDDRQCVVMERCESSIAQRIRQDGALSPDQAMEFLYQLLDALAVAHGAGIVHRDIKPENLLLDRQGSLKVADFGLAWTHEERSVRTHTGAVLGTVAFMAPELRHGGPVGPEADLYSAAATLAFMLMKRVPGDLYLARVQEEIFSATRDARVLHAIGCLGALDPQERRDPRTTTQTGTAALALSWRPPLPRRLVLSGLVGLLGILAVGAWIWPSEGDLPPPVAQIDYPPIVSLVYALPECEHFPSEWDLTIYPSRETMARPPEEVSDAGVGDFDGDGNLDGAFSHQLGAAISVFWDLSQMAQPEEGGGLQETKTVPLDSLAVGDFNGDGLDDIIGSKTGESGLVFLAGRTDRDLGQPEDLYVAAMPHELVAMDWNLDGAMDLIFLDRHQTVQWMQGRGDGSFDRERVISAAGSFGSISRWLAPDGDRLLLASTTGTLSFMDAGQSEVQDLMQMSRIPYLMPAASAALVVTPGGAFGANWERLGLVWDVDGPCRTTLPEINPRAVMDLNGDGVVDLLGTRAVPYGGSAYYLALGR